MTFDLAHPDVRLPLDTPSVRTYLARRQDLIEALQAKRHPRRRALTLAQLAQLDRRFRWAQGRALARTA